MLGGYAFGVAPTDGIGQLQSPGALHVRGGKGEVSVSGLNGIEGMLEVNSIDGRRVVGIKITSSEMNIPLPAGIYVVRCGRIATKVAVR